MGGFGHDVRMDAFVGQVFETVASKQADRFPEGARCRIRGHGTVHDVRSQEWLGGLMVPAPACGIGISGFDLSALEPTMASVTCLRCLSRQDEELERAGQLALFPRQRETPPR